MSNNEGLKLKKLCVEDYNLLLSAIAKRSKDLLPINVAVGDTFTIAGKEFIRFPETDEGVPTVMRDLLWERSINRTNTLENSPVLDELNTEILPIIQAAIGKENVLEFETDLTSLNGFKDYGSLKSQISLPTFDFFRSNIEIFRNYPARRYWYLATPRDVKIDNGDLCTVDHHNIVTFSSSYWGSGIRPILYLKPSVFASE
jgi:hypothetical protein